MAENKFVWEENDLTIEYPIGSGIFIPMREFNRLMDEEEERRKAGKATEEKTGDGKPD